MKNKKTIFIILGIVIGISITIFLLMGLKRKEQIIMTPPVKVTYPKLEENTTYSERIFDTSSMHEINIEISKNDWEDLIKKPLVKEKYKVDIIIDGKKISNVSFKTKGNSSLKNIVSGPQEGPASKRYSFKINFDFYETDQTYYGLDVLHLNNLYGDASYLNDYVSYETFRQLGVPSPLSSFAYLKINGNNFGLYSIVEGVGKAYLERNNIEGTLYKPEHANGSDLGASLTYIDDNEANYSNVFHSAETIITEENKKQFMKSLKQLNERQNLNKVVNIDEVINYFAVHNFLLSYDSYTGKSIHNYYLLEKDGMFTMLPWDYNLAFGRFNMWEDINTIVNYGIDSPLNQVTDQKRPMWEWIVENDEYRTKYHEQMNKLLESYIESKQLENKIDSTYEVIKPYIALDVSAFYTPEQVDKAVDTLKTFCNYRSQSIRLQLDEKLSTITKDQIKTSRIDATAINLNDMGLVADDRLKNNPDTINNPTINQQPNNSNNIKKR